MNKVEKLTHAAWCLAGIINSSILRYAPETAALILSGVRNAEEVSSRVVSGIKR
jgi:hypothetical protein